MTVPEPLELKINRIFMQNLIVKLRFAQRALHPSNAGVCVSLLQAGYAAAPAALSYEPLKSLWVDGNTAKAAQVDAFEHQHATSRVPLSIEEGGHDRTEGRQG